MSKPMPTGMVDAFNQMLYGSPSTMERRRIRHILRFRYVRRLIVEAAVIVGVLITIAVYAYASVVVLGQLG